LTYVTNKTLPADVTGASFLCAASRGLFVAFGVQNVIRTKTKAELALLMKRWWLVAFDVTRSIAANMRRDTKFEWDTCP
jgi:hypothetical protein